MKKLLLTYFPLRIIYIFGFFLGLSAPVCLYASPSGAYLCGTYSELIEEADYLVLQTQILNASPGNNNDGSIIKPESVDNNATIAHMFTEKNYPVPLFCREIDLSSLVKLYPHLGHYIYTLRQGATTSTVPETVIIELPTAQHNNGYLAKAQHGLVAAVITFAVLSFVRPEWTTYGAVASFALCIYQYERCVELLAPLYGFLASVLGGTQPTDQNQAGGGGGDSSSKHYGGSSWQQYGGSDKRSSGIQQSGSIHTFKFK